jgi:hypothetical protein
MARKSANQAFRESTQEVSGSKLGLGLEARGGKWVEGERRARALILIEV